MFRKRSPAVSDDSPQDEDLLLLDDLTTLVTYGLLEERPSPAGPVYALTSLGRHTPEFCP